MNDYSKKIIQVVGNYNESCQHLVPFNNNTDTTDIRKLSIESIRTIFPDTDYKLLIQNTPLLINPINPKQLLPAEHFYEYLLNEELSELILFVSMIGATKLEEWVKIENNESSSNNDNKKGNILELGGGFKDNESNNKNYKTEIRKTSVFKKHEPNFKWLDSEKFQKQCPLIFNNKDVKVIIEELKNGGTPSSRINEYNTVTSDSRQYEKMLEAAISFLGVKCNIKKSYEKVKKEQYGWKIVF